MLKNFYKIRSIFLIIIMIIIIMAVRPIFLDQYKAEPIVKGPGVTKISKLSDYFTDLKDTNGDTDVYILDGENKGGTILVLGGTHPIEPAGLVSAVLLVENAKVKNGKLIVIPHANNSGFTWNEPGQAHPRKFTIKTEWGDRWFRFGARGTNPLDQWPDPELYIHAASKQRLSSDEIRNLNRAHPGNPDGFLTEKIAYGIRKLIEEEQVDVTVDLHEAPPEKPLINAIVAHQRALDLATLTAINLEISGINIRLEVSPTELHGLSHRELGDYTDTLAVLLEVPNASQGQIHGRMDKNLILTGKDDFYVTAAKRGRLFVSYDEKGHPIEERVGRHLSTIIELTNSFTELYPNKPIKLEDVPTYNLLMENGVGHYLLPVK